jgi:flagellar biosynthesis protein FlhB
MSRDRGNAVHEPTVKRLRTAREEGNVARSSDLSTVLFLFFAVSIVIVWSPEFFLFAQSIVTDGLRGSQTSPSVALEQLGWELFELTIIPCILLFVSAVFSGVVQVGGLFVPSVAACTLSRVLFSGSRKLFGARGQMSLLFSITKLFFASGASLLVLLHYKEQLLQIGMQTSTLNQIAQLSEIAIVTVFSALSVLLILGIVDYCWQRYVWKCDLKMNRQEIVDEHKEQNPTTNGFRRHTAWLAKKCVGQVVPSIVVVGNKIAVAVRWNATTMSSPVVLAVFQGDSFEQYTEIATGATIVEDGSLATKLFNMSDVGLGIPPALHGEIASLLLRSRRDNNE